MPLTPEQKKLVVKGVTKYLLRSSIMVTNYENAKTYAIADYDKYPFLETRKKNYETAWNYMPAHYKEAIVDGKLVRDWIARYSQAMFGYRPSESEINAIIEEVRSKLASMGITLTLK